MKTKREVTRLSSATRPTAAICARPRRTGLRDRRRQARGRSTLRWRLRVAHQRQDHTAAGGAAISRLAEGRKPIPANQGGDADAADLPFLRRRDTGPRILFFPRARHAEVPGRPVAPSRHCAGMENASARSRSPATCAHPPPGPRLAGPHRRLEAERPSVLPRPHRAAATR